MKKSIFALFLAVTNLTVAQSSSQDDIDILQAVYGKEKTDLVNQYMALTGTQLDAFTKVYNEYEVERKALSQKKIQIISDYASDYENLNDTNADQLAKASIDNNLAYDKLYSKYYEKSKKVIGALNAAKFIQLEVYLQTIIRLKIQSEIPFIGQIHSSLPNTK